VDVKRSSEMDTGFTHAKTSLGQENGNFTSARQEPLESALAASRELAVRLQKIADTRTAEKRILEMIADGVGLPDVLNELCSTIDACSSGASSFVCLMDANGKQLWPSAAPRIPPPLAAAITPFAIGPNRGSCGTAAFTKQRVIIDDVSTDPKWPDDIREIALTHGVRAAWSEPLISREGEVLGTFCLSYSEPRTPTTHDLELIEAASNVARIAIERARSQEALTRALYDVRQSEATLRRIIDTIPALAWCNLPDGSNEYFNQRWYDYTGIEPGSESGKGWNIAFHPDDLPAVLELWSKLLTSGEPGQFESRIRRYDGVYRWFLLRVEPFRSESREIVKWYGTSTDIDDLKLAQAKLRDDEEELRQITDAIPQCIIVLSSDGRSLYANRAAIDYTGLSLEEILAENYRERIFHAEDLERLREMRTQALSQGEPFEFEQRALSKNGEYRWFLIQYNPFRDERGNVVRWYATGTNIDERKRSQDRMRNENLALREEIVRSSMFEEIVGSSAPLRQVLSRVSKVAPTDSTVLILGETGTGKELIARAIHNRSRRSGRAFIRINCAAIPQSLIASELFGHEKGAFTGALERRIGRFEAADGGTLFLDEIGDLPAEAQIMLLRVLQEREFERIGSTKPIQVDVRVLAATNCNLATDVDEGNFRQDLYYRLNVFPINVPPLRERIEDVPVLAEYLLERYAKKTGKKITTIDQFTLAMLQDYDWPGNIRELQNVIERAVILCETSVLYVDETWFRGEKHIQTSQPTPFNAAVQTSEREMIERALSESVGRIGGPKGAAQKLGLPRQTLESKIKILGIDKFRFKRT
jgi:formate hydrogenlyase transcriptional activator